MKITVGVSNRHVHLTEEVYSYLFDNKKIEKRNDLKQKGEFASTDTVDIEWNDNIIEHVRVLGPFRSANQIELLKSDTKTLGIDAPVRRSGDLDNTPCVNILANGKKITTNGAIIAERHVHISKEYAKELDLKERDNILITFENNSFLARVKVSENGYFELHIDKDDALEFGLTNGVEVEWNYVENR